MVSLRRAPALVVQPPELDDEQAAVLRDRRPLLRVLGAPGTGKTTTAVELVVDRVLDAGLRPDECLLLTSTRMAAGELRQRVTARLQRTSTEPLARTHQAFGFGILRREAALHGDPAPTLISGPEQDLVLKDLLAGHASGAAVAPPWPPELLVALDKRGFRAELRDLLMRTVEHGLEAGDLERLGVQHGRREWVAAAQVLREYDQVTAFSRPGAYDPAWILTAAADRLEDDPAALARVREQVRIVVVDDAQELTWAAARLLRVVVEPTMQLVLLGDPDAAVQTFRGADPRLLATDWTDLMALPDGAPAPRTVVLPHAYRQPAQLTEAARRVTARIGALGGGRQREARSAVQGGHVQVGLFRAPAQEAAHIATTLRRAHLLDDVPWSQMAVIVRGRGRDSTLRRTLAAHGVPVAAPVAEIPVRDEVVVRPLLALLDLALRRAMDESYAVPADVVVDLLLSPVGDCDAVELRRLRRLLRAEELAAGGGRSSDELLSAFVVEVGETVVLGHDAAPLRRLALAVAAGVAAARVVDGQDAVRSWAPGLTAEEVLWAIWEALELGDRWKRLALRGGARAERADRDLDAVVALFDAVARFVDRLPSAGPDQFLEHIRGQDVPGDTLVARAPTTDSVAVLTPASAAGRQWRRVVVAGVQEGVWPDLRLRGSLLGSADLVSVVTATDPSGASGSNARVGWFRAAQAAVRYDETRLFLVALTRATEWVLVTAVRSEDEQPSVYLDIVDPPGLRAASAAAGAADRADGAGGDGQQEGGGLVDELRPFTDVALPLTTAGIVARLRRQLLVPHAQPEALGAGVAEVSVVTGTPGPEVADTDVRSARAAAAAALAGLAELGVRGADPDTWWPLTELSDDRALRRPDQQVRVSPSKVDTFTRCGLRWLLTSVGGDSPSVGSANLGTLVHDIAHDLGDDVDEPTLIAEVEARWGRLGLPAGWLTDKQRDLAHEMVRRLAAYYRQAAGGGWDKVGSERDVRVDVGRARVTGRVDRLERDDDGGLRVVDYKTGSTPVTAADVLQHPQLATYQVAVEAGAFAEDGSRSAGAALVQLGKAAGASVKVQPQPPLAGAEDPGWAAELVERVAEAMGDGTFTATSGQHCRVCPVRTSCPLQAEGRTL